MLTREEYEEKRQARYERFIAAAEKAQKEGAALRKQGDSMFDAIPLGQPILIGHYSEQRDRNYRERARNKIRKGFELYEKAEYYKQRAQAIQDNNAIFSDDPDATEKIEEKIQRLEKRQERMKEANRLIRKNDRQALAEMGYTDSQIEQLFKPDCFGNLGYADFTIKNNGANIRRLKERLQRVEKLQSMDDVTTEYNGVRVEMSPSENRIRIYYGTRVPLDTYKALKSHGYRVLRSEGEGAFSAYYNWNAKNFIDQYLKPQS